MKKETYKSRKELAAELKIHRKTLYRRLKNSHLKIDPGLLSPEDQQRILKLLGMNNE